MPWCTRSIRLFTRAESFSKETGVLWNSNRCTAGSCASISIAATGMRAFTIEGSDRFTRPPFERTASPINSASPWMKISIIASAACGRSSQFFNWKHIFTFSCEKEGTAARAIAMATTILWIRMFR